MIGVGGGRVFLVGVVLSLFLLMLSFAETPGRDKPVRLQGADVSPATQRPLGGEARIRIVGINDLHGNLLSPGEVEGRKVGGVATLAGYLGRERSEKDAIVVHAGDMFGASPFVSAYLQDEPTVRAMNRMGFDAGVLGNHEFDAGVPEMMRLIRGEGDFPGAGFPHLAANVVDRSTKEPLLPPYRIIERDGVEVGFVGVVTPETADLSMPETSEAYAFVDLSRTVNRYAGELARRGVEVIVVLAHSGREAEDGVVSGEIVDEAAQISGSVDVIFAGHTHRRINARVPTADGEAILIEGGEYGEAMSVVDLTVNRTTGEIVGSSSSLVTTYQDKVRPDGELADEVSAYKREAGLIEDRVVGSLASAATREKTPREESALGDLAADARREVTGADFAFVPSGALRRDLGAGELTYGDLFAVNPSTRTLTSLELTGAQVVEVLESQYRTGRDVPLEISGLAYAADPSAPAGERVSSVTAADGAPLSPKATYTVAVDELLAEGGNGFEVFTEGGNRTEFGPESEALVKYFDARETPVTPPNPLRERRKR